MYIYWTAEENRKNALMEFKYTEDNLLEIEQYFDAVVSNIRNKNFEVKDSPDTGKVCRECDFRFFCSQNGIIKFKAKDIEEE
jgi:DNA helicase-2/ATP-dependent DNA helicase PcrA